MKIKSDFVTNSSSSCYVVCVPLNFTVCIKKILDIINNDYNFLALYQKKAKIDDAIINQIHLDIARLKQGYMIVSGEQDSELEEPIYEEIRIRILRNLLQDFVIQYRETTTPSTIIGVKYEEFRDAFFKIHQNDALHMLNKISEMVTND